MTPVPVSSVRMSPLYQASPNGANDDFEIFDVPEGMIDDHPLGVLQAGARPWRYRQSERESRWAWIIWGKPGIVCKPEPGAKHD